MPKVENGSSVGKWCVDKYSVNRFRFEPNGVLTVENHRKPRISPDFSKFIQIKAVEKPVENVENSCVKQFP